MDISVSLTSVRGGRQGIPKLTLNLAVEGQNDARMVIISLTAVVYVTQEMTPFDTSKSYFIGMGFLESSGGQLTRNSKTSWQISIPLSPYQLQKIEQMRSGKDLFLNVQFFCTAGTRATTPTLVINDIFYPSVGVSGYSDGYCPFKVAQSDWVKTLQELAYGDYVLCEIPLRGVPTRVLMKKALVHLENAWAHFNEDKDEETLVSCYKAFEFLAKQAQVKSPDQHAFGKLLNRIEDGEKRKRLAQLLDYLCRFLALARHEEGQEKVVVDRKDSEYALILAQASLAYLAKSMS